MCTVRIDQVMMRNHARILVNLLNFTDIIISNSIFTNLTIGIASIYLGDLVGSLSIYQSTFDQSLSKSVQYGARASFMEVNYANVTIQNTNFINGFEDFNLNGLFRHY